MSEPSIDEAVAKLCPRRRLPALVLLEVVVLNISVLLLSVIPLMPRHRFDPCHLATLPEVSGWLCGLMVGLCGLLPLWVLLPPARRAVALEPDRVDWFRPRLHPWWVFLAVSFLTCAAWAAVCADFEVSWTPPEGQSCAVVPAPIEAKVQRRVNQLVVLLPIGGLCMLGLGLWGRRDWADRTVRRVQLDERGLVIDGERYAYKDLTRVEVVEHELIVATHDDRHANVGLFTSEVPFAHQLAALVVARLPVETEDRSEARRTLLGLTERS